MSGKEIDGRESIIFDDSLIPDYDQTIKDFDDGDIVTGEVVRIDKDEILVDIGYKSEGAIPLRELSIKSDVDPHEIVKVGDKIEALVLQKEDKDGRLILSKKRAEYERVWVDIERIASEGSLVEGEVIEVVKGGLILNIGLRGFLPASLVDLRRVKDLHQYVGCRLECKIIEMDRNRNNVVLSRRAVLEEERKHERQKVLSTISKGQILTGKVSSIVDFGAFVDLGGIDGLVHISELSWEHVDHPTEVVKVGDEVKVLVLDVDAERGRISLGLKQTQENPWKELVSDFSVGQIVEGTVTKLASFGAFVQLKEGVEGLVHVSEIADRHVEVPDHVLNVGDVVTAKIVEIDADRRRVSLSIKRACESASGEAAEDESEAPSAGVEEETEALPAAASEEAAGEVSAEVASIEAVAEAKPEKASKGVRKSKRAAAQVEESAEVEAPDVIGTEESASADGQVVASESAAEGTAVVEDSAVAEAAAAEAEAPVGEAEDRPAASAEGLEKSSCGSASQDGDGETITCPETLEEVLAEMKANKADTKL